MLLQQLLVLQSPWSRHRLISKVEFSLWCVQAAAVPPDTWLWKNVYMAPDNVLLRTVEGQRVKPEYDPTYSQ